MTFEEILAKRRSERQSGAGSPASVAPVNPDVERRRREVAAQLLGRQPQAVAPAHLPAATAPAGPAPAPAQAPAPAPQAQPSQPTFQAPAPQSAPLAQPAPVAAPVAPPAAPRFGQPGYNPLLYGAASRAPIGGVPAHLDRPAPTATPKPQWWEAGGAGKPPEPEDNRNPFEKISDWATKDTYVGQQAASLATLVIDFIPASIRGLRSNVKMMLESVLGETGAKVAGEVSRATPYYWLFGNDKYFDRVLDASGNLRAEAKANLMDAARKQGGMTGAVIAGVSEGIADTILALKTMQALKVGYGQEAVKAGAPWFAKSWSVVKSAAVRAGIMTARTPHDNPKEFAKAYGISLAYQSTPAISRHFKDTASVIAADIALNSGITATQVKGLIDSAWVQAEAEGGTPEQVDSNAAIYATISMIQTIGSDIVFGAMTRAFKDAPPPVRDALEQAKARAEKVGDDLPTAKPMPVPVDDGVRGPETNPVLATPERPVLISNQPEAARAEEGVRISAPEEPAARVNPLLEPERVAQPAADVEVAPRPAEQVAAPEAARQPIEQARDESGAPDIAPREATSRLDESKHPTVELPIESLKLSADVPNFKEGASETGEVEPLQGRYERLGTPPVVVWERTNGDREIITGRHRWNLAKRSGEKTIPAQIVREADGFSKSDAFTFDAEANIRDGQGSEKDYANYFRNTEITREQASGKGLLARDKGRTGYEIGKSASDDLYALFAAGKISPRKAAAIAKQAPGQPEAQKLGMDYAEKHNAEQTEQYMRAVVSMAPKSSDKQLDLLGWDDSWQIQADKMGRAASDIRGELSAERTSLKHALSLTGKRQAEVVKKYGFKTGDKGAIKARVGELDRELISWENWNLDAELTATVRDRAGLSPVEKPAASDSFKLESSSKAELDAEAKRLADKAKLDDMATAPLEGRPDADIWQSRLPGTGGEIDLFNAPKQTAEAAPRTAEPQAAPRAVEPRREIDALQSRIDQAPTMEAKQAALDAWREANAEAVREIEGETLFHGKTKGDFPGGRPTVEVGSDADIMGKGLYVATDRDYVARNYGDPISFQMKGKWASTEQWTSALSRHSEQPVQEGRRLAREELRSQGYDGVMQETKRGTVGVVWNQDVLDASQAPSPLTLRPDGRLVGLESSPPKPAEAAPRTAPEPTLASRYTPEQLAKMKAHQEKMLDTMKGEPREAKAQDAAKPPELMTPEEAKQNASYRDSGKDSYVTIGSGARWLAPGTRSRTKALEQTHRAEIIKSYSNRKPVSAAAVDAYGIKLPDGYTREGDRYVFKGEAQGETPAQGTAPRTAADLAKPAQEPARVAEPAQEPAPPKPTTPLAKLVADTPQAFRVTSSRGNVHNVKMPDGVTYPIRAESKAEAIAKAQELAAKTKPLSEMNDADLKSRAEELGVPYNQKSTAKELRDRIRDAQQGGFIDIAPRTPSKDDHPFVRQMKENDNRVHEWQKRHTRDAISALRSEVVDRQADVKRALKGIGANDAIRRLVLRQGSGAEAARQFRVAEKSITDVLPTRDRELFKYYLQAMRVVEATKVQAEKGIELKSPMSAEDAKLFLNDEFVKLPQEQQDAVMGAAKKYWGVMREQLDALYAEGLISKEGYEAIATKHQFYSPRRFVEFIDPQTIKPKGEMRHDSGVDALDRGSESAMAADPMYLMAHVITRTQNRLFRNRANKALYDTAIASPENSVARVLGKNETPTRTEDSVSVFIDGQEVRMAMPKQLAAEWDGLPPALSRNMAALLQWASGTKILKTLATGANPEFAISNLPRDAMYAWFTSGQYSSVLPKALGQILLDYKRSMRDAIKRTGAYTDYVKEGGGMDFLTTQGMTRKPVIEGGHRLARKIGDILAWAGETSEIATRLAVRNRAIRNGLSPEEATYVARNMLDFSQGGTFAKAADNVIPYLNAAIQGTRGGFRAFKENRKVASFKAVQLIAMGYALAQVAATFTPELWDSINAREKASKWIIPLPWTRKDKEGNDRHAYIAIPKDQFQQVFAAIGQSFVDGVRGNPWKQQVFDSLTSMIPVEASGLLPPIGNAYFAYAENYDTWTSENVWQGYDDISPSKEQSWQTPEIAVDVAELASRMGVEISPERLATATSKVVPTSNPLGAIMSSIYATGNPDPELGRTIVEKLRDIPGIRRVLRFSRPSNLQKFTMDKAYRLNVDVTGMTDLQAREAVKAAERQRADVRYPLNVEADKIARQAIRGDVSPDDLRKWIDSVPKEEQKRVEDRIKSQYKKSWKSPSEIIRIITDPGAAKDPSKQANADWLAKHGISGMTAKDLRSALRKEALDQGWNMESYDSKNRLTPYGSRKLQLGRFIRKHNIE